MRKAMVKAIWFVLLVAIPVHAQTVGRWSAKLREGKVKAVGSNATTTHYVWWRLDTATGAVEIKLKHTTLKWPALTAEATTPGRYVFVLEESRRNLDPDHGPSAYFVDTTTGDGYMCAVFIEAQSPNRINRLSCINQQW